MVSPGDLGERLKPFVFLDHLSGRVPPGCGFGFHPHLGIATLTYQLNADATYEDTAGQKGVVKATGPEWMRAAGGINAGAILPLTKTVDVVAEGIVGSGIGRHASGQMPDVTLAPDGTIEPLGAWHLLAGVEAHPAPKLDLYAYFGREHTGQQVSLLHSVTGGPPTLRLRLCLFCAAQFGEFVVPPADGDGIITAVLRVHA
jgi:hypothetical protein